MPWLCQCGNGNLKEETPPQVCDLCGFDLWAHFGIDDSGMDVFCCECKTKVLETSEEEWTYFGQFTLCEECHDADLARHKESEQ